MEFNFSQNIEDNVEEAASGVKGENSVKLFGNNLQTLEDTAAKIKAVMAKVPGIADLAVLSSLGQPTIEIHVDRARAARFGLATGDMNSVIQAAIGGEAAGNLYETDSDRNYPIIVRLAPQYRDSLDAIRHIQVGATNPSGGSPIPVPLSAVADIRLVSGAAFIYREHQERYIPIKFSVRGRDLGGAVQEAQRRIAGDVHMPSGYRLEWVGEFGELQEALGRLAICHSHQPGADRHAALRQFLIAARHAAGRQRDAHGRNRRHLRALSHRHAVQRVGSHRLCRSVRHLGDGRHHRSGLFNRMVRNGVSRRDAIMRTCHVQFRPVMMTCVAACVGLLPAALSTGIGSQVQKPLALVVVGGMLLAPALILLVLPVLIDRFSLRQPESP